MIVIIQIAVITLAVFIAITVLGNRSTHSGKAWKKIALAFLAIIMVVAVLFPEMTNQLANIVGVGRGADLLLYINVIAFIFYALNNYLHQQDERDKFYRLARKLALVDANERYDIHKRNK